jgi:glutamate-ammonia-ligase adenylyltransferase
MGSAKDNGIDQELDRLPVELRDTAARTMQGIDVFHEWNLPDTISVRPLLRLVACSEFAAKVLRRDAKWFITLGDELEQPPSASELRRFCDEIAATDDSLEMVQGRIRRFRNRYLSHVLWREYAEVATLNETLYAISDLADELLRAASGYAQRHMQGRFGVVRNDDGGSVDLLILGMGKLGGRELNFSSDIDIIFLYPGGKDSDGRKSLSPQEYFARVARTIIALLDTPTADGFAFRVDTRLRPFGDSGPPVTSFAALESYLLQHGRDWERYAYVKARPVGPLPPAAVLADLNDNLILPFVYRRYLDYGVFESLREMHALISAEVQRRELADNIKLGPGGIREIEFIVQALQLVRGGGQAELQGRELQKILPRLAGHHDLTAADVEPLMAAYDFLRRAENFIQGIRDQQTHELPANPVDRARLCVGMKCKDWAEFTGQLQVHRANVAKQFEKIAFRERAIAVS